jgi:RNA polymerase sigma-70 factor (ECF subfamily)
MDVNQWPEMVRRHSPLVWRVVSRLVAHREDAADVFQETFVSAWEFSRRRKVENWAALLQHLATARAIDLLRRRRHRNRISEATDISEVKSSDDPPRDAEAKELAGQLRDALAELPAQQSEAYCLRHLEEMSYEDIAAALGMTVSHVGVTLHRATEKLRKILGAVLVDVPEGVNHES